LAHPVWQYRLLMFTNTESLSKTKHNLTFRMGQKIKLQTQNRKLSTRFFNYSQKHLSKTRQDRKNCVFPLVTCTCIYRHDKNGPSLKMILVLHIDLVFTKRYAQKRCLYVFVPLTSYLLPQFVSRVVYLYQIWSFCGSPISSKSKGWDRRTDGGSAALIDGGLHNQSINAFVSGTSP